MVATLARDKGASAGSVVSFNLARPLFKKTPRTPPKSEMGFFLLTIDTLTITVPHFIVLATGFTALHVGWHILFCRTPATPWIGAFQPRPRPIQVRAVEIFHKAAADPVSFACDILGY